MIFILVMLTAVVVAWLLLLVAMSDRRVKREMRVIVTFKVDTTAFEAALRKAALAASVSMAEIALNFEQLNRAIAKALPNAKRLAAQVNELAAALPEEVDS